MRRHELPEAPPEPARLVLVGMVVGMTVRVTVVVVVAVVVSRLCHGGSML
jgi:hypothetical protein